MGETEALQAQITHNTERVDALILQMQDVQTRLERLERVPTKKLDLTKLLLPALAIGTTLLLGTLGLEVTTLFFVLQHIIAR